MNIIKISGNISVIGEIKETTNSIRQSIMVAHNRGEDEEPTFFWVIFWGQSAIDRLENFSVGDFVEVSGSLDGGFYQNEQKEWKNGLQIKGNRLVAHDQYQLAESASEYQLA